MLNFFDFVYLNKPGKLKSPIKEFPKIVSDFKIVNDTNREKYTDFSWNFVGANTKQFTHCYHNYPAMMIPQIAERILTKYGADSHLLFDPYCGTGTSLQF